MSISSAAAPSARCSSSGVDLVLRLHGTKISPYFSRIWLQAQLKNLPLEIVEAGPDDPTPEAMRLRNPIGKIPFLEHGDRLFFESEVICEYLEDRFPEKPLRPASPEDRAKARLIVRTLDLYVMPPLHALTPQIRAPQRDETLINILFTRIHTGLDLLAGFLDRGPYAMGTEPGLADCALAAGLWYLPSISTRFRPDDLREGHGAATAFWHHIRAAPVFLPALNEMTAGHVAFRAALEARLAAARQNA